MLRELSDRRFLLHLGLFCLFNICLYIFIATQNHLVPFSNFNYMYDAHHFLPDPRIFGGQFRLLPALAQYDAQWYLKIAAQGYSFSPQFQSLSDKDEMQNLTFAFFPFYPLILRLTNFVFNHLYFSAFFLSNLLLLLNFSSLYLFLCRFFSRRITFPSLWLFFTFPFSVFFRSYYAEGLQLLLLIWFLYFLLNRRFIPSALFLGLLNITKGTTLAVSLVFVFFLFSSLFRHRISLCTTIASLLLTGIPFLLWLYYNYATTGNPFFLFSIINTVWYGNSLIFPPLVHNLETIANFYRLPLHSMHFSQIDIFTSLIIPLILYKSRRVLRPELWWTSFIIWALPLLIRDLASFSRYQSISFPLFIYLCSHLKPLFYFTLLSAFSILLFVISLYFVNWYWIG